MELSKEQVEFIEKRLVEDGVKYWDIRIEMLDHVVSDVENQMNLGASFDHALQSAFEKLGWDGSFDAVVKQKQSYYSIFNRREIWKELKDFFNTVATFFNYAILIALCYFFLGERTFIKIALTSKLVIFCAVMIFSLIKSQKVFKSASLLASFTFLSLQISLLNCFLFLPKVFLNYDQLSTEYLSLVLIVLYPFFYVGYKTFFGNYRKTNTIYQKLIEG
ncbi:MAG: hypothetical protein CMB99_09070 [Flavobacteriaceae bacterium]|nr:hypothetical protein [Flavobacteriaceae bacterium]